MTDGISATPRRSKNQGIIASISVIAVLAFTTSSFISEEASQFQLRSKYYADTSIYDHVVQSIYPSVAYEAEDATLEMRRGVEGLYYLRDDDDDASATTDDNALMNVDDFEAAFEEAFRASESDGQSENVTTSNIWSPRLVSPQHIHDILATETSKSAELLPSPACHPHFGLALPDGQLNKITKFKRIYLYHARKAGGSSMSQYFSTVAKTYGLDYFSREWGSMEEPGSGEKDTFYVAHMREPVSLLSDCVFQWKAQTCNCNFSQTISRLIDPLAILNVSAMAVTCCMLHSFLMICDQIKEDGTVKT